MDRILREFKTVKKPCLVVVFIAFVFFICVFLYNTGLPMIQTIISSLSALWWAIGIAYVMNLPLRAMENGITKCRKHMPKFVLKHKRGICLTITTILFLMAIAILFSIIIPQTITSLVSIINNIATLISNFFSNINTVLDFFNLEPFDPQRDTQVILNWLAQNGFSYDSILEQLGQLAVTSSQSLIQSIVGFASEFFNAFMGFLLSLYLLADKEKFIRQMKKILALIFTEDTAMFLDAVFRDTNETFRDFVTGQVTEGIIFGCICYIGMTIFNFPMAMLISVVVAVLCLIPMFGPTLGMFFGGIVVLTSRPILDAIWFMVFYQILQQVENNLIYPRVVGVKVGLPPVWVLLSIFVFGALFGFIGMLLGVPITAVIYTQSSTWINYYLKKHHIEVSDRTITYQINKDDHDDPSSNDKEMKKH